MATLSPKQQIAPISAEAARAAKVANAPIVGFTQEQAASARSAFAVTDPRRTNLYQAGAGRGFVNPEPALPTPATVTSSSAAKELRVRILVPSSYLDTDTTNGGGILSEMGGIIFPYTPTISFEHVAEYASQSPVHSNYQINFYKNSKISDISISGVFTVQNKADAILYLSIINVLRSLTKGRFGGSDPLRGSPPPICRLMAYGAYMLDNVPISISNFKNQLGNEVDYFYLDDNSLAGFGKAYVPVKSTIELTCKIMYSRNEMLDATVPKWQADNSQRLQGLL